MKDDGCQEGGKGGGRGDEGCRGGKGRKNCISTIVSKLLLPFPAQPLTLNLALMDMFMKVEKKDPNLLSVEDVREHCKLIRRSVETKEVLLQKMICFYIF